MSNYYILKKYFFPFVIIFFTGLYTYSMDGENKEGNEECPVCWLTIEEGEKIVLSCKHFFCKDCCYNHIVDKIKTNIEKIYCMTCSDPKNVIKKGDWGSFTEEQCLEILEEKGKKNFPTRKSEYEIWKKRAKINSSNGTIKACPCKLKVDNEILDCTGMLIKDEHNQYSKCEICTKEFCFKCLRNRDEHAKMKCEEYLKEMKKKDDEMFFKVYGENNIKKCPHCGLYTNRTEGCNHMTCANCKKEWCWLCNAKIINPDKSDTPQHYKFGQCNGKQFDHSKEKIEKDCVGWMLYILCCDCIF